MSEAEFLAWAEPNDERFELVDGTAVVQTGAFRDHERVAKALFAVRRLDSLVSHLVFDQKAPVVRVWRKVAGGRPTAPTAVIAGAIDLAEIGATIPLGGIYRAPRGAPPSSA